MRKVFIFLVILALPAALFATGQRGAGGDEGYIRHAWWGNVVRDERTTRVAELFMQQNPGVTVDTEPTPWDGYWPRLATLSAARNLPDVIQQDYQYIEQYNNQGLLADLNPFAQRGLINLSQWSEAGLSSGRLGNNLIALNIGTNALGMVVDPAVLQRAGVTINDTQWTWRDFEAAALQIYQRTGVQTSVARDHAHIQWEHIVRQFGVPFFSADHRSLGFTNHAGARAALVENLEMYQRLRAAGALYNPEETFLANIAMGEEPLATGRSWLAFYWSNQIVGFMGAAGRSLDYYLLPNVIGPQAPFGTYLKPGQFISMTTHSNNQDLAARYINFFVNDIEANRILLAERGIPIPTNVANDLAALVDADNRSVFDYIARIAPFVTPIDPPDAPATGEVRDAMRPILLRCLMGQISPTAAVDEMIRAANVILSR